MKRVLVIAYFFPPLANSGTQRPTKFVKYLPEFGWEPVVLGGTGAFDDKYDHALADELRPDTIVYRVPLLSDTVGRQLSRAFGSRVGSAINWRVRSMLASPDLYGAWRFPASRSGSAVLRKHAFDAILATGFPWSSLVIGRDLSRRTGLPFVADFRDLWTKDELYRPAGSITDAEVRAEKSIVAQASRVLTVSDVMTETMRSMHPSEAPTKFETIWNGYDPEDVARRDPYPPPAPGRLRIVYTGVWKTTYGPQLLYEAMGRLQTDRPELASTLELVTAGYPPGHAAAMGLSSAITELGLVSHPKALGLMASAHALYAPVPLGLYHRLALPGKLFEYLGVERPVFSTAAENGETARMLGRVGGGRVLPATVEAVTALLIEMCQGRELSVPVINREALAELQRQRLTQRLADVLDRAITRPS